jgi:hypothetical protein
MGRHARRQAAALLHRPRRVAGADDRGLWDQWKNRETGERIKSCAMIITEPNEFAAEAHDRMPVLLQ